MRRTASTTVIYAIRSSGSRDFAGRHLEIYQCHCPFPFDTNRSQQSFLAFLSTTSPTSPGIWTVALITS